MIVVVEVVVALAAVKDTITDVARNEIYTKTSSMRTIKKNTIDTIAMTRNHAKKDEMGATVQGMTTTIDGKNLMV